MDFSFWSEVAAQSHEHGVEVWSWLQAALLDHLWCGTRRQVMVHSEEPTELQQGTWSSEVDEVLETFLRESAPASLKKCEVAK